MSALDALRIALRPLRAGLRTFGQRLRGLLLGMPMVGAVDLGDLARTTPLCSDYGASRGTPIDRVYIERFLAEHAADLRGEVMEIGSDVYTQRFGGARVTAHNVLDVDPRNERATIVADLADAPQLDADRFDAVVLTQTLQLVFDVPAALATVARALRPGGTLLVTVCGASAIGGDRAGWCWGFTGRSLRALLERAFPGARIEVAAHGNVLTAVGFLEGLAASELAPEAFEVDDADYPVVVTARVVKPAPPR